MDPQELKKRTEEVDKIVARFKKDAESAGTILMGRGGITITDNVNPTSMKLPENMTSTGYDSNFITCMVAALEGFGDQLGVTPKAIKMGDKWLNINRADNGLYALQLRDKVQELDQTKFNNAVNVMDAKSINDSNDPKVHQAMVNLAKVHPTGLPYPGETRTVDLSKVSDAARTFYQTIRETFGTNEVIVQDKSGKTSYRMQIKDAGTGAQKAYETIQKSKKDYQDGKIGK